MVRCLNSLPEFWSLIFPAYAKPLTLVKRKSKMSAILLACFLFFCARHHHVHHHHRHYAVHSHHYARPLPSLADQPPPAAGKTLAPGNKP